MRLKSKRGQLADAIAALPPAERLRVFMLPLKALHALHARREEVDALLAPHIEREHERQREQRRKRTRQRKREAKRVKRAARSAALVLVLAFGTGCAGVTAEDIAPHVATARDLAARNNAAIATHCVGMPEAARRALMRDNVDHAARLAALQEGAAEGPGWISSVIAWALSFARVAGIVAAPQNDAPEQPAMDGTNRNSTEPETPAPDDDGDGVPDALEAALADPALWTRVEPDDYHPEEHWGIRMLVPPGTLVRVLGSACPCGCVRTSAPGYVWVVTQAPELPTPVMLQLRRPDFAPAP